MRPGSSTEQHHNPQAAASHEERTTVQHTTAINGRTATCTCGWTLTALDVGRLQAATIGHELDPPPPDPTPLHPDDGDDAYLNAVRKIAAQLELAEQAVADARALRDRAACTAIRSGAPVAHVARAAGISRQAVYDIIERQ